MRPGPILPGASDWRPGAIDWRPFRAFVDTGARDLRMEEAMPEQLRLRQRELCGAGRQGVPLSAGQNSKLNGELAEHSHVKSFISHEIQKSNEACKF